MSFDALTLGGVAAALLAGAFLVGVASQNDRRSHGANGSQRVSEAGRSNGR
jgi:hypothetical protein